MELYYISVEEAANRVFVVGRKSILSVEVNLLILFGLKRDFCTTRSSRRITCNRAYR